MEVAAAGPTPSTAAIPGNLRSPGIRSGSVDRQLGPFAPVRLVLGRESGIASGQSRGGRSPHLPRYSASLYAVARHTAARKSRTLPASHESDSPAVSGTRPIGWAYSMQTLQVVLRNRLLRNAAHVGSYECFAGGLRVVAVVLGGFTYGSTN
jgi:hypothetical protein